MRPTPLVYDDLSRPAKDLIFHCLQENPEYRSTAEEVVQHVWLDEPSVTIKRRKGVNKLPGFRLLQFIHEELRMDVSAYIKRESLSYGKC